MKLLLKTQFIIFITLFTFSCNDAVKTNINTKVVTEKKELPTNARGLMEDRYKLFTYNKISAIEPIIIQGLVDVTNGNKFEINNNTENVTKISTDIEISNGKGVVPEWRCYNVANELTHRFVYNPVTALYVSVTIPTNASEPNGGCPSGSQYLGSCSYDSSFERCVGDVATTYIISALTNNKTATVTVTNTASFARICASSK